MKSSAPIDLFSYQDYRLFLKDWYEAIKKTRASFSYRAFSKRAGFKSTNFFLLVMTGQRNLTEESLNKFVVGLSLNKQEQDFFKHLVFFNQAKTNEEKDLHYHRLLQSRKFSQLKPIEKQQYDYYNAWYHPVIRELVVSDLYDGTALSIAQRLFPAVTVAQVEKSIELLEALGFITKKGSRWEQASAIVSTGAQVSSLIVHKYHSLVLDMTKEVLNSRPASERDVSTMTLGIVKQRLPELKKKVRDFRQEVLKMVSGDVNPELVVQLNMQLIPVTQETL